jgi:DNA-binding LytR/AlgR family response regulator
MFKLKVSQGDKKEIADRLRLVETPRYTYVVTDDKGLVEDDKVNIVFPHAELTRTSRLLDMIVKGEELHINGYNQYGQKSVECRNIQYFIVEQEDVFAVLSQTRLVVKQKLYELEELLEHKDFIRISKYCLVNIGKIDYIRSALNSKLDLQMANGDHCEVNRSYLKTFKKALKL